MLGIGMHAGIKSIIEYKYIGSFINVFRYNIIEHVTLQVGAECMKPLH